MLLAIEGKDRERAGAILRALYLRLIGRGKRHHGGGGCGIRFTDETRVLAPGAIKTASSRAVRPRTPAQAAYLEMMRQSPLVFGIGPAGTGKTYLAAAFAAHMLHEKRVERLILSRPALEAGERHRLSARRFEREIDPYLRPLYDALFDVLGDSAGRLMEARYHRSGATGLHARPHLKPAFVILDEAQNTTQAQIKMALTRLGEDSHMVVTGDPSQSDLPGGAALGLNEALFHPGRGGRRWCCPIRGKKTWYAIPLVARIVAAYNRRGKLMSGITLLVEDPKWRSHRGLLARLTKAAEAARRNRTAERRLHHSFWAGDKKLRALKS